MTHPPLIVLGLVGLLVFVVVLSFVDGKGRAVHVLRDQTLDSGLEGGGGEGGGAKQAHNQC